MCVLRVVGGRGGGSGGGVPASAHACVLTIHQMGTAMIRPVTL